MEKKLITNYYFSSIAKCLHPAESEVWKLLGNLQRFLDEYSKQIQHVRNLLPTQIVKNSFVADNAYLGDFCLIRDSYIGDGAVIGSFCEISRSIIMHNSIVAHHNFIGYSIIGAQVEIAGNVRTIVHRFDRKILKIRFDKHLYDIGLPKFGVVIGDKTKVGSTIVFEAATFLGQSCLIGPFRIISGFIPSNTRMI